jgi:MoaA/NifB/PqqE/SkfB family radical SAM enzyme
MSSPSFPLPTAKAHQWVVYLTARCNFSCDYCIQKGMIIPGTKRKPWGRYDELSGEAWVSALNGLAKRPEHTLILTGGEPSLHRDFLYIATHLEGYRLDLTSNLSFDIDLFIETMKRAGKNFYSSFHTYHPKFMAPEEFVRRARKLRDSGVIENPVFSLLDLDAFPHFRDEEHDENIRAFYESARSLGLDFQRNEFRGNHMGDAFTHEQKQEMGCTSGWVNFAPNGDIHNCQFHLEARKNSFGNITDIEHCKPLPAFGEFFACGDFGFCDPCHENSGRGAFMDSQGKVFRRNADDSRVYLRWMKPEESLAVARRFLDEGKPEEASHAFLVAIGKQQDEKGEASPESWSELGLSLWASGEEKRALAAILHAIQLGKRDPDCLCAAVELGRRTGHRQEVRVDLLQYLPQERLQEIEKAVEAVFV